MIGARRASAWLRLGCWADEAWGRHVSQRELYQLLDGVRAECVARTAWVDELTEEGGAALLHRLAERVRSDRDRG